jgi:hypothetical protein
MARRGPRPDSDDDQRPRRGGLGFDSGRGSKRDAAEEEEEEEEWKPRKRRMQPPDDENGPGTSDTGATAAAFIGSAAAAPASPSLSSAPAFAASAALAGSAAVAASASGVDPKRLGLGLFERHTKGFASRYLQRFGFQGRLGRHEQGISEPVLAHARPDRMGLAFGEFKEAASRERDRQESARRARMGLPDAADEEAGDEAEGRVGADGPMGAGAGRVPRAAFAPRPKRKQYKTAAELLAATASTAAAGDRAVQAGASYTPIIDMRGRKAEVLSSYADIRSAPPVDEADDAAEAAGNAIGRELMHNVTLMCDLAAADLTASQSRLQRAGAQAAEAAAAAAEWTAKADAADGMARRAAVMRCDLAAAVDAVDDAAAGAVASFGGSDGSPDAASAFAFAVSRGITRSLDHVARSAHLLPSQLPAPAAPAGSIPDQDVYRRLSLSHRVLARAVPGLAASALTALTEQRTVGSATCREWLPDLMAPDALGNSSNSSSNSSNRAFSVLSLDPGAASLLTALRRLLLEIAIAGHGLTTVPAPAAPGANARAGADLGSDLRRLHREKLQEAERPQAGPARSADDMDQGDDDAKAAAKPGTRACASQRSALGTGKTRAGVGFAGAGIKAARSWRIHGGSDDDDKEEKDEGKISGRHDSAVQSAAGRSEWSARSEADEDEDEGEDPAGEAASIAALLGAFRVPAAEEPPSARTQDSTEAAQQRREATDQAHTARASLRAAVESTLVPSLRRALTSHWDPRYPLQAQAILRALAPASFFGATEDAWRAGGPHLVLAGAQVAAARGHPLQPRSVRRFLLRAAQSSVDDSAKEPSAPFVPAFARLLLAGELDLLSADCFRALLRAFLPARLESTLREWNPAEDQVPPNEWIFPWFQLRLLPDAATDTRAFLEPLWRIFQDRLVPVLSDWQPNTDASALAVLAPWQSALASSGAMSSLWTRFVTRWFVPKMVQAVGDLPAGEDALTTPADVEKTRAALAALLHHWAPLLPDTTLQWLLQGEVFPRLYAQLYDGLRKWCSTAASAPADATAVPTGCPESSIYGQVLRWYIRVASAFPGNLRALRSTQALFNRMLLCMEVLAQRGTGPLVATGTSDSAAVPSWLEQLQPHLPATISFAQLQEQAATADRQKMLDAQAKAAEFASAAKGPTAAIAGSGGDLGSAGGVGDSALSFAGLLEVLAGRRGLQLLPHPSRAPVQGKYTVYRLGDRTCFYVRGGVVFVENKETQGTPTWEPISVQQLMDS